MNNFKYYEYINNYKDIELFTIDEAYKHYTKYGIHENRVYNTSNLDDFNYHIYINNYSYLKKLKFNEAILHYIRYGKYENKTYKIDISNFNYNTYINNYNDIKHMDENEALEHYINYGYYESRTYKIDISNFNYFEYIYNYDDLIFMNEKQALEHYIKYGYDENRKYDTNNIEDFNYNIYIYNYDDLKHLNEYNAKLHYIRYGRFENRIYNYKIINLLDNNLIYNKINFIDYILWINLDSSTDRYEHMQKILTNINIPNIRISGINGKNNIDNIDNIDTNNMNDNEIGCLFSHIKAINYINNLDGKYFLILEDDVMFDNLILFRRNLEHIDLKYIILNSPKFDILILYKTYNSKLKEDYTDWNTNFNNNIHYPGTVAYIINKDSINKIINLIEYKNDRFIINVNKISPADYFIYSNCITYVYKYNFINTLNNNSLIHQDHCEYNLKCSKLQTNIILNDLI